MSITGDDTTKTIRSQQGIRLGGWVRDTPDSRDHAYAAPISTMAALPAHYDLRNEFMPDVYDQGSLGSCTANAIAGAVQYVRRKYPQTEPDFMPSRLFIYYNERAIEHTVPLDNGAQLRDGVKSVSKFGVCPEPLWPYNAAPADEITHLFPSDSRAVLKPEQQCFDEAIHHQAVAYWRMPQALNQMRGCIAEGFPFVFGFTMYSSFFDVDHQPLATTPLPAQTDDLLGGHAVLAVGYDDTTALFTIRNSWGPGHQDRGYFRMPYSYLSDPLLAADFWTIRKLEG